MALTVNQWKHDHIKLITRLYENFLMYIWYVAVYEYLTSSGLTTARRAMYACLSNLIIYVYDQFVSVAIMEYFTEFIVKRHLHMNCFGLFKYTLLVWRYHVYAILYKATATKKQFSVVLVIFRRMLVNPKLYLVKL